jgi:uncharacterized membrane protein
MVNVNLGAGIVLALVAMVSYGLWAFFSGLATRTIPPETAAVLSYLIGGFVALGYLLYRGLPLVPSAQGTLFAVIAGLAVGVAVVAFYSGLRHTSIAVVSTVAALYFVVAALLEIGFLGRELGLSDTAGIVLAAVAILLLVN